DVPGSGERLTIEELVRRRLAGEPLQLLLGRWPFRTVELELERGVFVPRPETEVVAGFAIDHARALGRGVLAAEPCTGSGAIACALVAEVDDLEVVATDLDPRAVALARRNLAEVRSRTRAVARRSRGEVHLGDLLEPLPASLQGRLDLIVANPPYLPLADRAGLAVEVADHDPAAALFGGVDGHEVVDRLIAAAVSWLAPGGALVVEIDERRGPQASERARAAGLEQVRTARDLAGRDRVLLARAP
ncbi:MAG: N5-glutamine methyltransferase family protein, partial [Nitriliruptoraceae bacterium]